MYEESFFFFFTTTHFQNERKNSYNVSHYLGRQALNINTEKMISGSSEKNEQDITEAITANSHKVMEWPGLEGTLKSPNSTAMSRDTFH